MYLRHPEIDPPVNDWFDRDKPKLIQNAIEEICESILKKGDSSKFPEIFDYLYLYVEDNIEKFLPDRSFWELS
jgi:hypothetical protein